MKQVTNAPASRIGRSCTDLRAGLSGCVGRRLKRGMGAMRPSRAFAKCALVLAFWAVAGCGEPISGDSDVASEPVRYSAAKQFADFRRADYVALAKVERVDVMKRAPSERTRDVIGDVRDVTVALSIERVLRGDAGARRAEWRYPLQFGVEPTLREGDVAVFFFNRAVGDAEPIVVRAVYLNEDSAVPLARRTAADAASAAEIDVLVAATDEEGAVLGKFWVRGEPDAERDSLAGTLAFDAADIQLVIAGKNAGGWSVLESIPIKQRWPY
ncbi:MAG TPA: hypothetical protein VFX89_20390 [Gammaproteobacteria bacterium]|nr:hypothetical protein [Gammaproteobacteria bacterium]